MRRRGVGNDVDDLGGVLEFSEFLERQEAHARKVRFRAEHAVELDGVAHRFVHLQAKL